jgi:YHS domain-containing protein
LGVRVGMHTGTAVRRGEDWFGSAVNVASRIADMAHAGEVIVSAATRDAAASCALAGELRSQGRRSLKHVSQPIEVFALLREGDDRRHELPVDPVCRITVNPASSDETIVWRGVEYHFCSSLCAEAFRETPIRYLGRPASRALVLVSDDARESATQRLARAYAKGRIDCGELEQRIESAWSARTRADLNAVTRDLPRRRRRAVPVWQLPIFPLILLVRVSRARIRRVRRRRGAAGPPLAAGPAAVAGTPRPRGELEAHPVAQAPSRQRAVLHRGRVSARSIGRQAPGPALPSAGQPNV